MKLQTKINFDEIVNTVFLSPYVIPIPKESTLEEKAKMIMSKSIMLTPYFHNMNKKQK